jgi:sigma-B regulation protein RsbU (phosphoserine phosphatase)
LKKSIKVLAAEDNIVSRRILENIIPKWGFDLVSVSDGRQAWEKWSADSSIQMAVLDWMMPELDGLDVCRMIRQAEQPPRMTYIIILTARGHREDVIQGLSAGANDYITKPFDSEEFRSRLDIGRRMTELQSALAERVMELESALSEIRTLQGLIPICMHCHKIRDEKEVWTRMEEYVSQRSGAKFSHGICPDCLKKYYPENKK